MSNVIDIKCTGKEPPKDDGEYIFLDLSEARDVGDFYRIIQEYTDLYDDDGLDNITSSSERKSGTLSLVEDSGESHKPKDIMAKLDEHIIGQESVKKIISVAVYNHYKRINNKSDVALKKSNVMLVGPTGSGKTLFAQTIAKTLNVPLAIADATSLTEAGYVGEDVESILQKLFTAADADMEMAEKGIIYIDEIDKIRCRDIANDKKDVSGEGVQQALLKLIEGSEATFKVGTGHNAQQMTMDTSNILFIVGGAFAGIEQTIEVSKEPEANGIGFSATVTSPSKRKKPKVKTKDITLDDLKNFGMIPELMGRIPTIAKLEALDAKALRRILTEPKDSIVKHYEEMFRLDGSTIEFSDKTLKQVAKKALKNGTGARGLQTILEEKLMDLMFEAAPDQNYII